MKQINIESITLEDVMLTDKTEAAHRILAGLMLTLPEAWKGVREVWHAWHEPYAAYQMTFPEFCERVIEVYDVKPENEVFLRLRLMKPVIGKFEMTPVYVNWQCAYINWKYAEKRWEHAYANQANTFSEFEHADVKWKEAKHQWQRSYAEWDNIDRESIRHLHDVECTDCTWDWDRNAMTFPKGK